MPSLYSTGWRQGSMFDYTLALNSVVLEAEHGIVDHPAVHDSWVVASQDCTLDQNDIAVSEPILELRPIWTNNPPTDWGIRARKFLLSRSQYVDDYSQGLQSRRQPYTTSKLKEFRRHRLHQIVHWPSRPGSAIVMIVPQFRRIALSWRKKSPDRLGFSANPPYRLFGMCLCNLASVTLPNMG